MDQITAIVEINLRAGVVDRAFELFGPVMDQLRDYGGCTSARLVQDRSNPDRLFIVTGWESFDVHEEYQEWRLGEGALAELGQLVDMLTEPPRESVCDTRRSV